MPEAGEDPDLVALDLLARRPPVPLLTAPQIRVDRLPVEDEPGGQTREDPDEGGPVGLASGRQLKRH